MKALSLWQPHAIAVATKHLGPPMFWRPFALCSGQGGKVRVIPKEVFSHLGTRCVASPRIDSIALFRYYRKCSATVMEKASNNSIASFPQSSCGWTRVFGPMGTAQR
jgi:hypothetical protein